MHPSVKKNNALLVFSAFFYAISVILMIIGTVFDCR